MGQDVDRLRYGRRSDGRPAPDAEARTRARAGQGRRRCQHARHRPGGARHRLHALRDASDRRNPRGVQTPAGRGAGGGTMREYHVALVPGDGIGHEVCPEGVKVIAAVADLLGGFSDNLRDVPVGLRVLFAARRDDGEGCAAHPGALRRHLLRRGGLPQRAGPHLAARASAARAPGLRAIRQRTSQPAAAGRARPAEGQAAR